MCSECSTYHCEKDYFHAIAATPIQRSPATFAQWERKAWDFPPSREEKQDALALYGIHRLKLGFLEKVMGGRKRCATLLGWMFAYPPGVQLHPGRNQCNL